MKAAAVELQRTFAQLEWITPTPAHFMHVTIGHGGGDSFAGIGPFEIAYRRVNCFNEAVVVEVAGDGPRRLAERHGVPGRLFLPHLTVGYVRSANAPDRLREILPPLRNLNLGVQRVEEVVLCRVPAARTTILEPWTVVKSVQLN